MARQMNVDIKELKSFIDRNPEYVLVLLSDHGVDEFGAEGENFRDFSGCYQLIFVYLLLLIFHDILTTFYEDKFLVSSSCC